MMVPYIQKQNGNLSSEFPFLIPDVTTSSSSGLPDIKDFFRDTFFNGLGPDSMNFWMGFSDTVSSMHKDPYENIYAVIRGEKHFTLAPPTILPFSGRGTYKNCKWNCSADYKQWWLEDIVGDSQEDTQDNEASQGEDTVWSSHNPDLSEDYYRHFAPEEIPIFHVILKPGEVLYLPALWFHQVTQFASSEMVASDKPNDEDYVIAVNFWFDMEFD